MPERTVCSKPRASRSVFRAVWPWRVARSRVALQRLDGPGSTCPHARGASNAPRRVAAIHRWRAIPRRGPALRGRLRPHALHSPHEMSISRLAHAASRAHAKTRHEAVKCNGWPMLRARLHVLAHAQVLDRVARCAGHSVPAPASRPSSARDITSSPAPAITITTAR